MPRIYCCNQVHTRAFDRPEPYAGKLARTVLGGAKVSNGLGLPDNSDFNDCR